MFRMFLRSSVLLLLLFFSPAFALAQNSSSGNTLDYDRDGVDDLAIYRPNLGLWVIRSSSDPIAMLTRQWGLPNDYPIAGDYTGDGIADLVVWRPSNGNWYICRSDSNFNCFENGGNIVYQFGLSGDRPIKADYDNDGVLDLAVWRPALGLFIYRSSKTGEAVVSQWGLASDIPLQAVTNR